MAKIPEFKSLQEEAEFWDTHSYMDYLHDAVEVTRTPADPLPKVQVVLHLPQSAVNGAKVIAARHAIDPETLMQVWVMERLAQEMKAGNASLK